MLNLGVSAEKEVRFTVKNILEESQMHIIRPEIFYICSVVNNISYISCWCLIVSAFATGIIALFYLGEKINDEDDAV